MDQLTAEARSERMRLVRSKDTQPELRFRRALARAGYRSRASGAKLPGKPDFVFKKQQLAVFIDGDFWHGHQWRRRKLASLDEQFADAKNREYWRAKIRRNVERDFRHTAALVKNGWGVLRFWESDLAKNFERHVQMTIAALERSTPDSMSAALSGRVAAEFFAGVGLVRLALEHRGWSVAFANDFDPQKAEMYRANFSDEHLSTADIHSLSADELPTAALFTASFPCNDLSVAGAKAGLGGKQSSAFFGFARLLEEMEDRRPPLVLLENVVGFLSSHGGRDFETALQTLNALGYACDAFILNASSFVPQSRARLFVVGKLSPQNELAPPIEPCAVRPAALVKFINAHPAIHWDLRRLPAPPQTDARLADIVEDLPANDPAWWSEARVEYFMNQLSPRHLEEAERRIAAKQVSYATAFRRIRKGRSMAELRFDGIAGCLRTPRGGSGRQILFKAGKNTRAVRLLSARECARLQGTPDTFRIEAGLTQALFAFGDAVCVPAIEWILEHCLEPALGELLRGRLLGNAPSPFGKGAK